MLPNSVTTCITCALCIWSCLIMSEGTMDPDNPTSLDEEWEIIQLNTFTRWCNEHLKSVHMYIYNLQNDLTDGIILINLLEELSHTKAPKFHEKPIFKWMETENVAIALKMIEKQNIKLVNIDALGIVSGNLKQTLGLIWALILKYQISVPLLQEDDGLKVTPKQALLGWINDKVPDLPIKNFQSDWNDAKAIGALVNALAPGLCPDWEDWQTSDALENARKAMKFAEDWLNVPQVLIPADLVNPNVDELSVMTYVSAFVEAELKPGASLLLKLLKPDDIANLSADEIDIMTYLSTLLEARLEAKTA